MKKFAFALIASVAVTLSVPATAQFAKPEDAIKYRQSALFVMQQNFARVATMAA
ncbi:MAG: cytochrome c, partial [Rhodoferax sp.]